MNRATKVGTLGIAALTLTGVSYGETGTATNEELMAHIAALEAKVDSLQNTNQTWLTEARAEEVKDLVYDVLADADTRASLLQGGGNAGYDNGFVVSSSDGNFLLRANAWLQTTWMYNNRDVGMTGGDENRAGFQNTRTKIRLSGHVVSPDWRYAIQTGWDYSGSLVLEDAWIQYDYGNGWAARMGQFKAPLLRESLVSSRYQLASDRSLVEGLFSANDGNRVQGIMAHYSDDSMRFAVSYNDGASPSGTSANTAALAYDTEYAFTGRIEGLLAGNWDQFEDFTNPQGGEDGWLIGGAVHFQEAEFGTGATEAELTIATVDISGEFDGANLFAAFIYSEVDPNTGATEIETLGFVAQGGIHLSETTELFGRYEWADLDMGPTVDDQNVITVGINEYFARHQVKWTTEVSYGVDSINSAFANMGKGFLADTGTEDGQFLVKTQLQLLF